jgi:hypothetical protein
MTTTTHPNEVLVTEPNLVQRVLAAAAFVTARGCKVDDIVFDGRSSFNYTDTDGQRSYIDVITPDEFRGQFVTDMGRKVPGYDDITFVMPSAPVPGQDATVSQFTEVGIDDTKDFRVSDWNRLYGYLDCNVGSTNQFWVFNGFLVSYA